jgi:hypothetical protein
MPPCPTRRAVLGGGAATFAAIALSACGIRLEDDAPRLPGVPERRPIPAESFLLALWRHTGDLERRAAGLGGVVTGLPARLAALHREQAMVLRAELATLGVPESVLADAERSTASVTSGTTTGTTGPTGSATTSSATTPAPSGPKALAAEEASDLGPTAIASLAQVSSAAVPLVGSVLAQRSAAATLLGAPARWPEPAWSTPSLAATYLETTRAAVYGFEVVTAQSPGGAQHRLAAATLASLRARAARQETWAGESAGPPDLAYPLPFAVTTPAAARRLAVAVLTDLRAAVARELGTAGEDTVALGMLVQWLADSEVLASRWGVALAPFPGLK